MIYEIFPSFLLFSKIWHVFLQRNGENGRGKDRKTQFHTLSCRQRHSPFPRRILGLATPRLDRFSSTFGASRDEIAFQKGTIAFLRNWPGSISRIDASSRFSTHVARYAGIRGGPCIHRWDKSAHPSRSKYPFPLDIWRLHRHSWHAVPSTDPRSVSLHDSLWYPMKRVSLPTSPWNCITHVAAAALSMHFFFATCSFVPLSLFFLSSSPSVSLARNLWRRATSTKNNWTIRKSRRSFWEKWLGTGA